MTLPWNEFTEALFNALMPLVGVLLLALFALVLQLVIRWLPQGWARNLLVDVTRAAYEAAVYAQQVYVSEVRKAGEDRKLTPEERHKALQLALDYWMSHAPVKAAQALVPAGKSLEEWARELIESKVPEARLLINQAQVTPGNSSSQG